MHFPTTLLGHKPKFLCLKQILYGNNPSIKKVMQPKKRKQNSKATPNYAQRPPGYPSQQTLTSSKPLQLLLQSRIGGGGENVIEKKDNEELSGWL